MESAREFTLPSAVGLSYEAGVHTGPRPEHVVFQVDTTVSTIDGFAWLAGRRDPASARGMDALHQEASVQRWSWADLTRARLRQLRPRRAEVNELGAAYLAALSPGIGEAIQSLRRAGISVSLASDVAAEALFGVGAALGVSPEELYAPRLRFDAIGAYVGCDADTSRYGGSGDVPLSKEAESHTWFVGTRRSAMFAPRSTDVFVFYSATVAREGRSDAVATVATFRELAAIALR